MSGQFLKRRAVLDDITWEVISGIDGQGKPTYATAVALSALARDDRSFIPSREGAGLETVVMFWVPEGETGFPSEQDRITWNGTRYLVRESKAFYDSRKNFLHQRLRCGYE